MKCALITLTGFLYACSPLKPSAESGYYQVPSSYFKKMIDLSDAPLIIDVRTSMEYNVSHISGATHISYLNPTFGRKIRKLEPRDTVFIYCQTMHRSPFAANVLKKAGFKYIYDLKGGYKEF